MRSNIIRITVDSQADQVMVLMPGQQHHLILSMKDWKEAKKTLTQKDYVISRYATTNGI